jgi:Fe-S-cluster containining protein
MMNDQQIIAAARRICEEEIPDAILAFKAATGGHVTSKITPIYRRMDEQSNAASARIACRDGCNHCCYFHVVVTPAEAFALAEFIQAMPEARREVLMSRLAATATRVAPMSEEEYRHTNVPCAFLDGGSCSVYPVRPAACRGHHALDVRPCIQAFDNPLSTDPHPADAVRRSVEIGFKNVLKVAQQAGGCDAMHYEMHGAVSEALTNRAAFKRWKAGKVAFPSVKDRQ